MNQNETFYLKLRCVNETDPFRARFGYRGCCLCGFLFVRRLPRAHTLYPSLNRLAYIVNPPPPTDPLAPLQPSS